jgi:hypothetical protein
MLSLVALSLLTGYPREASAYIDVGTGSALLQLIIASVMSGMLILKIYWRELKTRFGGRKGEVDDPHYIPSPPGDPASRSGDTASPSGDDGQ